MPPGQSGRKRHTHSLPAPSCQEVLAAGQTGYWPGFRTEQGQQSPCPGEGPTLLGLWGRTGPRGTGLPPSLTHFNLRLNYPGQAGRGRHQLRGRGGRVQVLPWLRGGVRQSPSAQGWGQAAAGALMLLWSLALRPWAFSFSREHSRPGSHTHGTARHARSWLPCSPRAGFITECVAGSPQRQGLPSSAPGTQESGTVDRHWTDTGRQDSGPASAYHGRGERAPMRRVPLVGRWHHPHRAQDPVFWPRPCSWSNGRVLEEGKVQAGWPPQWSGPGTVGLPVLVVPALVHLRDLRCCLPGGLGPALPTTVAVVAVPVVGRRARAPHVPAV